MPAAPLSLHADTFHVGSSFQLTLQRTVRLPIDGRTYPLPPGFGPFPVAARAVGFLVPMHDREAMWLSFGGEHWRPVAVKVGIGGVNAITGEPFDLELRPGRQDYMVVPNQPWLDGIKAGDGFIRQFVAVPLGQGQTVESHVTGRETTGGLQIAVFQPVPGRFPDQPPPRPTFEGRENSVACLLMEPAMMGYGAGGKMAQRIYPDEYGIDCWDASNVERVDISLVHANDWKMLTGETAPRSPINAQSYITLGLPWFGLADEDKGDVPASTTLAGVAPVNVEGQLPIIMLS